MFVILQTVYRQLDDDQEHVVMLVLNMASEVVGFKVVSSGLQASTVVDAKIIFRNALMLGAAKIILAYNHPGGDLKPSAVDIQFTKKLITAGKSIDISVVDNFIVSH